MFTCVFIYNTSSTVHSIKQPAKTERMPLPAKTECMPLYLLSTTQHMPPTPPEKQGRD